MSNTRERDELALVITQSHAKLYGCWHLPKTHDPQHEDIARMILEAGYRKP